MLNLTRQETCVVRFFFVLREGLAQNSQEAGTRERRIPIKTGSDKKKGCHLLPEEGGTATTANQNVPSIHQSGHALFHIVSKTAIMRREKRQKKTVGEEEMALYTRWFCRGLRRHCFGSLIDATRPEEGGGSVFEDSFTRWGHSTPTNTTRHGNFLNGRSWLSALSKYICIGFIVSLLKVKIIFFFHTNADSNI